MSKSQKKFRRRRSTKEQAAKFIIGVIGTVVSYGYKLFQEITSHPSTFTWLLDRFLLFIYIGLWLFATITAIQATRILYGHTQNQSRIVLLLCVILSVTTCITGFAMSYLDISASDPWNAFSTRAPLSAVEALYFSIVTFATVGYGDISPASDTARIVVGIQILISMFYTVLIFSVVAGFIRQPAVPATTGTAQAPAAPPQPHSPEVPSP